MTSVWKQGTREKSLDPKGDGLVTYEHGWYCIKTDLMIYVLHQVVRVTDFWDVMRYSLVDNNLFRSKWWLHLQGITSAKLIRGGMDIRKDIGTVNLREKMRPLNRCSNPYWGPRIWRQNVPFGTPFGFECCFNVLVILGHNLSGTYPLKYVGQTGHRT
jgi:hypothetical protein